MAANICRECEELKKASLDARHHWMGYRPMHTGHRPKSRWLKEDRNVESRLHEAYNLAEAKYQLHLNTHADSVNAHDTYRNLSIVIRNGRLTP